MINEAETPSRDTQLSRPAPAHQWIRSTDLPREYRTHELVRNKIFFTLPESFLRALVSEVGNNAIAADLQQLELDSSRVCGDHTQLVGFCCDRPVGYHHLRRQTVPQISAQTLEELGWEMSLSEANSMLRSGEARSLKNFQVAQGYAGWLLTNPTFIKEQDDLLVQFAGDLRQFGLPGLARAVPSGVGTVLDLNPNQQLNSFLDGFETFLLRWRLSSLAAPNLPVPIQPQMPSPATGTVTAQMNTVGASFFVPDIYPLPSREELRSMMEESLRGADAPEHLADWTRLVRGENRAKNKLIRFGRIFELQHYARILQERHPAAIHRRLGALERVFAKFFNVSSDAIHLDLQLIRDRLGSDWLRRNNNVSTSQATKSFR